MSRVSLPVLVTSPNTESRLSLLLLLRPQVRRSEVLQVPEQPLNCPLDTELSLSLFWVRR